MQFYVYVEDAVTLGAPHQGAWSAEFCGIADNTQQCKDMAATSDFTAWLRKTGAAQAEGGIDWTAIGSEADIAVLPGSSTPPGVGIQHLVLYREEAGIDHSELRVLTRGRHPMTYSNDAGSTWTKTGRGAAPLRAAFHALYFHSRW
ncbi:hypothetical protein [Streptomyces sp. NPDC000410]|uniref:hypothetical protein n=1 Tax=Streptomyces sp. NPDC000410 TaxID=3154254 RepID=UPI003316806F